ncbi:MAG TPA: hypothetical protein VJ508_01720, partial [Saprospiraceae bacterium]|nr:hypothetical protein [Saprospiraceae bacterium]
MNWNCLKSIPHPFSRFLVLSLLGLLACHKSAPELVKGNLIIIPLPVRMEIEPGAFIIDELTWIQSDSFDHSQFNPIRVFDQVFKLKSGYSIPTKKESIGKNDEEHVILIIRSREHKVKDSYRLRIS